MLISVRLYEVDVSGLWFAFLFACCFFDWGQFPPIVWLCRKSYKLKVQNSVTADHIEVIIDVCQRNLTGWQKKRPFVPVFPFQTDWPPVGSVCVTGYVAASLVCTQGSHLSGTPGKGPPLGLGVSSNRQTPSEEKWTSPLLNLTPDSMWSMWLLWNTELNSFSRNLKRLVNENRPQEVVPTFNHTLY